MLAISVVDATMVLFLCHLNTTTITKNVNQDFKERSTDLKGIMTSINNEFDRRYIKTDLKSLRDKLITELNGLKENNNGEVGEEYKDMSLCDLISVYNIKILDYEENSATFTHCEQIKEWCHLLFYIRNFYSNKEREESVYESWQGNLEENYNHNSIVSYTETKMYLNVLYDTDSSFIKRTDYFDLKIVLFMRFMFSYLRSYFYAQKIRTNKYIMDSTVNLFFCTNIDGFIFSFESLMSKIFEVLDIDNNVAIDDQDLEICLIYFGAYNIYAMECFYQGIIERAKIINEQYSDIENLDIKICSDFAFDLTNLKILAKIYICMLQFDILIIQKKIGFKGVRNILLNRRKDTKLRNLQKNTVRLLQENMKNLKIEIEKNKKKTRKGSETINVGPKIAKTTNYKNKAKSKNLQGQKERENIKDEQVVINMGYNKLDATIVETKVQHQNCSTINVNQKINSKEDSLNKKQSESQKSQTNSQGQEQRRQDQSGSESKECLNVNPNTNNGQNQFGFQTVSFKDDGYEKRIEKEKKEYLYNLRKLKKNKRKEQINLKKSMK